MVNSHKQPFPYTPLDPRTCPIVTHCNQSPTSSSPGEIKEGRVWLLNCEPRGEVVFQKNGFHLLRSQY